MKTYVPAFHVVKNVLVNKYKLNSEKAFFPLLSKEFAWLLMKVPCIELSKKQNVVFWNKWVGSYLASRNIYTECSKSLRLPPIQKWGEIAKHVFISHVFSILNISNCNI